MRIGVRLGPVSVSTSTHSRRRSRPSQPSWHATGHATTPDGREVDFRCQHSHRSQDAAINCAATVRKQVASGQNLHLITRVRSTPASRQAARQREAQQAARRQAKAAQHTQAAQQRAADKEARHQARAAQRAQAAQHRAQQKETLAIQRQQQSTGQNAPRAQGAQQRAERAQRRRPRGWPVTGLIIAGGATLLGIILAGIAGSNPKSALGTTAGGLITLGILAVLICATAALLQWRRKSKNEGAYPRVPVVQNIPAAPYPTAPSVTPTQYTPGPYPGPASAAPSPLIAPPALREGPPWPYENSGSWPR